MLLVEVTRDMDRAFANRRIVIRHRGDETTLAQSTQGVEKVEGVESG